MMDAWSVRLAASPFMLLDGALATELERCGCDLDDPLWSAKILLEQPERVLAVHRVWLQAGAEILTTASYQATFQGLAARGLDRGAAAALLRRSVELAREAIAEVARPARVAASIGSYGALLADGSEYRGGYGLDRASLIDFHHDRLRVLSEQADLLAFETIPDATEIAAISELLERSEGPLAWVSLSLRRAAPIPALADGTDLREAIAPLLGHPRVLAIGVNCVGPAEVAPALARLRERWDGPLVAYPNSGERWHARGWVGGETTPDELAELARTWWSLGAKLIGGCCRTRLEHIAALARLRERLRV